MIKVDETDPIGGKTYPTYLFLILKKNCILEILIDNQIIMKYCLAVCRRARVVSRQLLREKFVNFPGMRAWRGGAV